MISECCDSEERIKTLIPRNEMQTVLVTDGVIYFNFGW